MKTTRREALLAALGALAATRSAAAEELAATPRNELGPFYRRGAPRNSVLTRAGDTGSPLKVTGRVLDVSGQALPRARIELWHANDAGHYDVTGNRFRAELLSGPDGGYGIATIMPGHYPDRVCQHVHYLAQAAGYRPLVTQLYFETDPVFEGDPDRNFMRDPLIVSRELVRPVTLQSERGEMLAQVRFDLVLEPLR